MKNDNLYAALAAAFPAQRDASAIETEQGLHYSWRDLERASAMLANLLASLGLPAGARIAVQVEKSVEALMLYLATLRAGYVFLPLNSAYQAAELRYFLQDAEPAVLVCAPANLGWTEPIASAAGVAHLFTLDDQRGGSLLAAAAACSERHECAVRGAGELAVILYTSGTTGRSKGAMLSHGNMLSNAQVLKRYWGWKRGDVLIHALPIFHIHGLFVAVHGALLNASKMIWLARFEPRRVLQKMAEATIFMGVPTMYVRLLADPQLDRASTRAMRLFVSGSAPLLLEHFEAWRERTGHTILERYGMSETVMLTSNPCGPDRRHGERAERRGGTVGFPLPGVDLRLRDERGQAVAASAVGAIEVKGPNVFQGYWRMPEKTAEEFSDDGYFKTGDVGRFDADGYLCIVGRSKDLIISGGYNVYPAEIETYINALPGVLESAVVGAPDPDFGEVGHAFVVARPGAALAATAILGALKATLANFKVPKRCTVLAELPRNAMGKVQKNLLRAQAAEAAPR
ncbi:MAG: malonyl-CoA synthase [Pseudomonadota bacterium]